MRWPGPKALVVVVAAAAALSPAPAISASLRVSGAQIVDGPGAGHELTLLGVNRSGTEYACIGGYGFFESPHPRRMDSPAMIDAIKSWDADIVRVPLNEDCWLGINGPQTYVGARYRRVIERYVGALRAAGLYVILDLHVSAPGRRQSRAIDWMLAVGRVRPP